MVLTSYMMESSFIELLGHAEGSNTHLHVLFKPVFLESKCMSSVCLPGQDILKAAMPWSLESPHPAALHSRQQMALKPPSQLLQ